MFKNRLDYVNQDIHPGLLNTKLFYADNVVNGIFVQGIDPTVPVPKVVPHDHSSTNEVKVIFPFMDGICPDLGNALHYGKFSYIRVGSNHGSNTFVPKGQWISFKLNKKKMDKVLFDSKKNYAYINIPNKYLLSFSDNVYDLDAGNEKLLESISNKKLEKKGLAAVIEIPAVKHLRQGEVVDLKTYMFFNRKKSLLDFIKQKDSCRYISVYRS